MAEVNNGEEPTTLPTKRTPDLTSETPPKKQKLETPTQNDVVQKPEDENEQEVEEENEEEKSNGKAVIDRKGKGILIEEEEGDDDDDDSDDSDSDSGSDSDAGNDLSGEESDFVDDPLAEVDLDNILPSRTRRRITHPGAYIANDIPDDDSDNSDDPDA